MVFCNRKATTNGNCSHDKIILNMVDTKLCNHNKMNCLGDACFFKNELEDSYIWNQNMRVEVFDCSFKKTSGRRKKRKSTFFSPLSSCQPSDLFCSLYDSIVIWNNNSVQSCPFTKIHYCQFYNVSTVGDNGVLSQLKTNFFFP